MPVIARIPYKFATRGVNLTQPCDLLPPGFQPHLVNVTVTQTGALQARNGSTTLQGDLGSIGFGHGHTVRRLNNLNPAYSSVDHILLAGFDDTLYAGEVPGLAPIVTGLSGNPLSIITYRPDQSTAPWAYIGDANKMRKVDVNQTVRNIGIRSPSVAPTVELESLPVKDVDMTGSWAAGGTAAASSSPSRVAASTTVFAILYDTGTTGWACIAPTNAAGDYAWLQSGERIKLHGTETVTAEGVTPAIPTTSIASIIYDSGTTGLCSITLASTAAPLARNSMIVISAEPVRILSVTTDTLGNISFRCSTVGAAVVGNTVTGLVAFRCFTTGTIAAGHTITDPITIQFSSTTGIGYQTETLSADLSVINGRAVGPDDYMFVSVWTDNPANIIEGRVALDVDAVTNDFLHNAYYYAFRASDLTAASQGTQTAVAAVQTAVVNQSFAQADPRNSSTQIELGSSQYTTLQFRISDLIRIGTDGTRSLANVAKIRIQINCSATCIMQFDSWFVAGTYGTDVAPGSPTGIYYFYRYRATESGARSNPSPAPRFQLFPSRQAIDINCTASSDAQVDVIDIFRYDPALQSGGAQATIVYIATVPNSTATYSDQNVAALIAANPQMQTNLYQPWPVLAAPLSGTVDVSGTTVHWRSGDAFPPDMVPGTVLILGTTNTKDNHQSYSFPSADGKYVELLTNGGAGVNVAYTIASPLLAGQPLPILFGPLEGPTATFTFGLGDLANPGTLYWTNGNDPDSSSDINTLEITSPSEPLIGGCVWNTLVYVFSRDRVFLVRPSFDAAGTFVFTFYALQAPTGLWGAWAIAPGQDGVYYLGRDGLYRIAGENVVSITDATTYPLFRHGLTAGVTTNGYLPVDLELPVDVPEAFVQLNYAFNNLWFNYIDTGGAEWTWQFPPAQPGATLNDRAQQGVFPQQWPQGVTSIYLEQVPPNITPRLLMTTTTGRLIESTGTLDDGAAVVAIARTASLDGGDPRSQKLYVDLMTDLSNTSVVFVTIGYNNYTTLVTPQALINTNATRRQTRIKISSLEGTLNLYRNIAMEYQFGAGVQLFEAEPSGYLQPYLSCHFISRSDHGFPDWQCLRDGLFALISQADVTLTIDIDGVQVNSPYTLLSTSGDLRKVYQIFRHASKGRMFIWQLDSSQPFALFTDETIVRLKSWTGDMIDAKPFQGAIPG